MKKKILVFLIAICMMFGFGFSALAAPTNSFTHKDEPGGDSSSVLSREMYTAVQTISESSLGLEQPLAGLTDVFSGEDGTIYILCGDNSRLVLLNKDYTLKKELVITDENNQNIDFTGAQGVFADKNGHIYIADTNNGRVIVADQNGKVQELWGKPQSSLLPEEFIYQPIRVAIDEKGYIYILSFGCYYGALSYSPEGEFLGFYGANTVKASALDTLSFLWDKLTGNDVKKAQTAKQLPYSFVDLCLDAEGYMITCTGATESSGISTGQIRKISPSGSDILYKRDPLGDSTTSASVNFLENEIVWRKTSFVLQNIISLDVDKDGFIYALDKTYGLVYVYDTECNTLNGFGGGNGIGKQLGAFEKPIALTVHGGSLLVADSERCNITVFNITPYGKLLREADKMYIKGDYNESKSLWEEVLSYDSGNQLAYRGLAMAAYNEGEYKLAKNYAKSGLDYTVYDLAHQAVLSNFVKNNFIWILVVAVIFVGGLTATLIYIKKRQIVLITNPKIKTLFAVPFHPYASFEDLKYKKQSSVAIGIVLTMLLYIGMVLQETASGFLFIKTAPQDYNMLYTLAQTAVLVVIWSVSNWLICSLFSGKGRFKEVFTATTYALLPLIVVSFVRVILSHFLPLSGLGFMNGLQTATWIFTFFLLCIAIMIVHEYDFFKFLITGVVTVLFMILIVFILFLLVLLFGQLWEFINTVFVEIAYR